MAETMVAHGNPLSGLATFIIGLALYIFFAYALETIAKKTGAKDTWRAYIPIWNFYLMTEIINNTKLFWISLFVNIIGGFLAFLFTITLIGAFIGIPLYIAISIFNYVVTLYIYLKIAEKRNKSGVIGFLASLPLIGIIGIAILAWKD